MRDSYLFFVILNGVSQRKEDYGITHLYLNGFFVCANSPSLCPTISCVTFTGRYSFPLCTMKRALSLYQQESLTYSKTGSPNEVW